MSHGIQFFTSSGQLVIEADETFTRVIYSEKKLSNFNGTISVPNFNDTKGMFYVSYYALKVNNVTRVALADNTLFTSSEFVNIGINPHALPNLIWNNTTKLLTVTPHSLPTSFETWGAKNPPYEITFIHNK
jgi:hypothetical protein